MKPAGWLFAGMLGVLLGAASPAMAQGNGHGQGKGHEKHKDSDEENEERWYSRHEGEIRDWYYRSGDHLPPGLAKKDRLPPGLEKQLIVRGSLPPGLQKRIYPCPSDLVRILPPPPPDCAHVLIGGHIVLLNRKANIVVDILHVEGY